LGVSAPTQIFHATFAVAASSDRLAPNWCTLCGGRLPMLAGLRFLFSLLLAYSVAACLPVQAQINGVPPSVTSFGFSGSTNPTPGVRASVTSLGPNGNSRPVFGNCCANFFMPASPYPPLFRDRQSSGRRSSRRRHHHEDSAFFPIGVGMPAYVPCAVPYAEEGDDDSVEVDPSYSRGPRNGARNPDRANPSAGDRDSDPKADASAQPVPPEPEQFVAA